MNNVKSTFEAVQASDRVHGALLLRPACSAGLVVVIALAVLGAAAAQPDFRTADDPESREVTVLQTSAEEYNQLLDARARFGKLPQYDSETRISQLPTRGSRPHRPFLVVVAPDGKERFVSRSVSINVSQPGWRPVLGGFRYFPETKRVFVRHTSASFTSLYYRSTSFETTPFPTEILRELSDLPYLEGLHTDGGTFSTEAISMIARHPSLRVLQLGRCRVSPASFSPLGKLQTLEQLGVIAGLTPQCFVTLAELPRFRGFTLSGATGDFNRPIDDATRRAIESLDGRLEYFVADTIGTTIHPEVIRALLKVRSLQVLRIDSIQKGLTISDVRQLEQLTTLTDLQFPVAGHFEDQRRQEVANAIVARAEESAKRRADDQRAQLEGSIEGTRSRR